jgi:hypothetical protein
MNHVLKYIQKYVDFSGEEISDVLMMKTLEKGLIEFSHLGQFVCRWKTVTIIIDKDEKSVLKAFRNGHEKLARSVLNTEMCSIFKGRIEEYNLVEVDHPKKESPVDNIVYLKDEREKAKNQDVINQEQFRREQKKAG